MFINKQISLINRLLYSIKALTSPAFPITIVLGVGQQVYGLT